ncbi:aminoglycoside 6'-N-acetyltransferase [Qipengyuania qiaonensis]|uniref:Aminoglycoside N(6')-acetyltransferase type 1 n=1 Tax=Qipengyuania qiaonensis TaxID=2867240 RepID=A0ABS7J705_9SPHN|nr:aminoglycoside 6'-N-acetyltransferase [Qipengyuania qiaonensis]MBX7483101.1 GNAT family N-acetyltransferase [Qipengyuania qiaonensis]
MSACAIIEAAPPHLPEWGVLRFALWPWDTPDDHAREAESLYLSSDPDRAAFVALDPASAVIGFAEATLRRDYVEGCGTSPVGFLEGIYVSPDARLSGVARQLADKVAAWAKANGCTEYASNALLDNADSHAFHAAIGFAETERVVYFRKRL